MPYYYFEAVASDGHIQKKILRARDRKDADRQLRSSGLHPIVIESARVAKKKKQEKQLSTRRIVRNTFLSVTGISLVLGVAIYMVVLDLSHVEGYDVKALSRSGIISQSSDIVYARTPEEREFGREMSALWEMHFPDSISGIDIQRKTLMMLHTKKGIEGFAKEDLELTISAMTYALYRRFESPSPIVMIAVKDQIIAEGRYINGEVLAAVY